MHTRWAEAPYIELEGNTLHVNRPELLVRVLAYNPREVSRFDKPLPHLTVQGSWLRDLGFEAGAKVLIAARKGFISIGLKRETDQDSLPRPQKKKQSAVTIVETRLQLLKQRRLGSSQ